MENLETDIEAMARLAKQVGVLTAQLREANAFMSAYMHPRRAADKHGQIMSVMINSIYYAASCEVDPGEPACHDPEYASPATPSYVEVTHLWINGEWVDAQEMLGQERCNQLGENLTLENEL